MANFNKVFLMGNLTRDPEVRFTNNDMAICKFGLAVNRRFQDGSGEWREEPTFVDITIFGKRGEAFSRYHKKGQPAFIEGSLRFDQWEDKQSGQKRSKLYVVGDNWEFVGGKGSSEGGEYSGQRSSRSAPDSSRSAPAASSGASGGGSADEFLEVDDTPF